jgi:hypothetical protein
MSFWGVVKYLQGEYDDEASKKWLDLGRELAANCSPSDAPLHRPPVSSRGALFKPPNWRLSSKERADQTVAV